jgi:autotransporter-associated beta strand protein
MLNGSRIFTFLGVAVLLAGAPNAAATTPTTTSLSSVPNPSSSGQTVTFTATVSPVPDGGTVTFTIDGIAQASVGLIVGQAQLAVSNLSVNSHTVTAVYNGDSNYQASPVSNTVNQVVNPAGSLTISSSLDPSVFGQSVTFTAIVPPGTTGTIIFAVDGVQQGSPVTIAANQAQFATTSLAVGNRDISATYTPGNAIIVPGTVHGLQIVNKSPTATTVTSSAMSVQAGQSVTFTAAVAAIAPGTGIPTGLVTFFDGGSSIGTTSLIGGAATFPTSSLTVGSHKITATYNGDGVNYSSSTGSLIGNPQVVTPGPATHFAVSTPASVTAGSAFSVTVTALDQFNNTAIGYGGTLHVTSTDGLATLPANYTFQGADAGVHTFSNAATLRTSSSQTITATDTVNSSITGTSGGIMVNIITGVIHLLAPGVCPSGSNWTTPACWDLNRAPASGDAVIIDSGAQAQTVNNLSGVSLASLTINSASSSVNITGNAIGLNSGASIVDSFNNSATDTLPGLSLNGPVAIAVNSASQTLRISGAVTGGASSLTKNGAGTLILAGSNTYGGSTQVNGGTLSVTGSLPNSAVTVNSGGSITGTGTVSSISAQSGGSVSGNLTATNGTTFAAGSTFAVTLTNASTFTQLSGGTVNLTAGPTLTVTLAPGYTPSSSTTFIVVPSTVIGAFSGLANGATFSSGGIFFRVNYASVTLTSLGGASIPALSPLAFAALATLLAALGALVATAKTRTDRNSSPR